MLWFDVIVYNSLNTMVRTQMLDAIKTLRMIAIGCIEKYNEGQTSDNAMSKVKGRAVEMKTRNGHHTKWLKFRYCGSNQKMVTFKYKLLAIHSDKDKIGLYKDV